MFKFGKNRSRFAKSRGSQVETLIGKGTIIEGKIVSEAGLRIEGQVQGDIESSGDVTIGEKGVVHSNIVARNIYAAGTVHGSVKTEGRLLLSETGKLFGTIEAAVLTVEDGALFQGSSRMEPKAQGKDAIPLKGKGAAAKDGTKEAAPDKEKQGSQAAG